MTAAKITTAAKIVSTACKVVSNAATFTQAAIGGVNNAKAIVKNMINGKLFSEDTAKNLVSFGINAFTAATSGKNLLSSSKELKKVVGDSVGSKWGKKAKKEPLLECNLQFFADKNGCETSYGKSSEKLNRDAIVSKKGETRVEHIKRHTVQNNSRETHSVFNGNPIDMVNDACEERHLVEPISDGMGGTIYNIPYKNAGYESGYINTGAQIDYITIVTLDESTDLITAFPSFGDYHK